MVYVHESKDKVIITCRKEGNYMNNGLLDAIKVILEEKFKEQDEKFSHVENRLDGIDNRLDGIDNRLDGIDNRLDGIDERLNSVEKRLDIVEEQVADINMTLENEIIPNIKFIAEGHIDLKRKMDSVMEKNDQMEWMSTHLLKLDMDVKKIVEHQGAAG